jgi:hypothetical protein
VTKIQNFKQNAEKQRKKIKVMKENQELMAEEMIFEEEPAA